MAAVPPKDLQPQVDHAVKAQIQVREFILAAVKIEGSRVKRLWA